MTTNYLRGGGDKSLSVIHTVSDVLSPVFKASKAVPCLSAAGY